MTAEQFVYWLQGYLEISNPSFITKDEIEIIQDHIKLVFDKQTPVRVGTGFGYPTTTPTPNPYTITCTDTTGNIIC